MPQISPLSWLIIPFFLFIIFFFVMVGFWWSVKISFFFNWKKNNFNSSFLIFKKMWIW